MAQQTYPTPSFGPGAPQYGPPAAPFSPPGSPYGYPAPSFGPPPVPPSRRRTRAVIGAVLAGVLVLGGLAVGAVLLFGTKILDSAKAEYLIAQATEDRAGVAPATSPVRRTSKRRRGRRSPARRPWKASRSPSPSRRPTTTATSTSTA